MTIKAKPVLKNKFWIIEDGEQKLGTLSWDEEKYIFSSKSETCFFNSKRDVKKKFGVNFTFSDASKTSVDEANENLNDVNGYPTSVKPYNAMYNVARKLPLFTKSEKSKSLYCAGYYIIRFDKGWVKSFCPKLITVDRYETRGPFKTEFEMKQELSRVNS